MANFPEDDERDLDRELAEAESAMDGMASEWPYLKERRNHLRKEIKKRQLEPLVAKAIELAQNLGHALGANEALAKKIKHLESRIDVRDEVLSKWEDHDELKERAEKAEASLKRRRKR